MFVFSSMLVAATWFLSRLAVDRIFPCWRARADRRRRRFSVITAIGAIVASCGFGGVVAALFTPTAGVIAAACLLPAYVFIAIVLAMLLSAFEVEA